jgi:hypothetical protein
MPSGGFCFEGVQAGGVRLEMLANEKFSCRVEPELDAKALS